jgi:hypothetical protein
MRSRFDALKLGPIRIIVCMLFGRCRISLGQRGSARPIPNHRAFRFRNFANQDFALWLGRPGRSMRLEMNRDPIRSAGRANAEAAA